MERPNHVLQQTRAKTAEGVFIPVLVIGCPFAGPLSPRSPTNGLSVSAMACDIAAQTQAHDSA